MNSRVGLQCLFYIEVEILILNVVCLHDMSYAVEERRECVILVFYLLRTNKEVKVVLNIEVVRLDLKIQLKMVFEVIAEVILIVLFIEIVLLDRLFSNGVILVSLIECLSDIVHTALCFFIIGLLPALVEMDTLLTLVHSSFVYYSNEITYWLNST